MEVIERYRQAAEAIEDEAADGIDPLLFQLGAEHFVDVLDAALEQFLLPPVKHLFQGGAEFGSRNGFLIHQKLPAGASVSADHSIPGRLR